MSGRKGLLTGVAVAALLFVPAIPARAQSGVLYELTESQRIVNRKVVKRTDASALAGWIAAGSPICPDQIAQKHGTARACYVNVKATNRLNESTGTGPVSGTFDVLIQDKNVVDAPEVVVISGSLSGQMDLSPAVLNNVP